MQRRNVRSRQRRILEKYPDDSNGGTDNGCDVLTDNGIFQNSLDLLGERCNVDLDIFDTWRTAEGKLDEMFTTNGNSGSDCDMTALTLAPELLSVRDIQ